MRWRGIAGPGLALIELSTLAACSSSGDSVATTPTAQSAAKVVDDVAAGNFVAVTSHFDKNVATHYSGEQLAKDWQDYQQRLGNYVSHGGPKEATRGGVTIEQVPMKMSSGKGEVRVSYNPDGTIAGLYFLKS